jgi:opacity protein-like surface antigen
VAGLLATLLAVGLLGAARASEPLAAGTKELGLGGAVSISHGAKDDFDTVAGLQLLPHVGYVVSDAMGPDWLRGSLEVLLEPSLIHLESDPGSATVVGVSALGRWIFSGTRLRPYLDAGVGVLLGETHLPQTDCPVNFLLQGGPGLLFVVSETTTLAVGYRYQHISNATACTLNPGINSSALYLGVNYLFR